LPAFTAIGYHEAWEVADGLRTLGEAIHLDAQRNVAFAKRQRTWFRSEPDIDWLDAGSDDLAAQALELARRLIPA
jgi:tRNA dimethylallyltransferase